MSDAPDNPVLVYLRCIDAKLDRVIEVLGQPASKQIEDLLARLEPSLANGSG